MAVPFRVKAVYEYTSSHDDDLNFDIGQVITVTEEEDDDWYVGEYVDDATGAKKEGLFPRNFVEKFEPTAPPRPTRTRKKEPEQAPQVEQAAPPPPPPAPVDEPEPESEEADEPAPAPKRNEPVVPVPVAAKAVEPAASAPAPMSPPAAPKQAEAAAPAALPKSKPAPPPVAEKPASNSFKDRIAAFNKPAAPPVAPFKPGGLSSGGSGGGSGGGFIKKPFVAPPPSRNAYVPPVREKPPMANVYRREEDPDVKEQEAETLEQAEKAGLVPSGTSEATGEEDQPQPTSLKERIALLQKQQMEQAQRHAEAATKKEKPKKPAKKRPEATAAGEEASEAAEGPLSPSLERVETAETEPRTSTDDARASTSSRAPPPPRRKASKGQALEESHDGNEADMSGAGDTTEGQDDTTEREDNEEASHRISRVPTSSTTATAGAAAAATSEREDREEEGEEEDEEVDEDEEEEDVDPEVKRKEELRARMAKMSGGMGFHGMFGGAPMPPTAKAPPKKKAPKPAETTTAEEAADEPVSRAAPPIPTPMALPGMGGAVGAGRSAREDEDDDDEEDDAEVTPVPSRPLPPPVPTGQAAGRAEESESEDEATTPAPATQTTSPRRDISGPPPPIPGGRPVPPPVPTESRAPPPPPPSGVKSPTDGSESDDELSGGARERDTDHAASQAMRSPPMPPQRPQSPGLPPKSPMQSPRGEDLGSSPSSAGKRSSRPPPPIPGSAPAPPPASSRPPPPPPPGGLSRQSTADANLATPTRPPQAGEEEDEEVTEYEGDYDTDIGSSVPHKDALKAHARDSSLEDNTLQSPIRDAPPSIPPPVPTGSAPRAVPPPVPSHAPPPETTRRSTDAPRAAPPPPPPVPSKEPAAAHGDDEYDPYNYTSPTSNLPMGSSYSQRTPKINEDEAYFGGSPPSASLATSPPPDRRAPPAAPVGRVPSNRPSTDLPRTSTGGNRRSLDAHRPSVESGFIANDVDLSVQSGWWKQANQVPTVFMCSKEILYEIEESTRTIQGSKTTITRDVFILFQDYSQTVVTVRYDPYDPSDVEMAQRHEPPPRPLRQDEMEEFYERFGRQISDAAGSKKDTVVGDGSPQGFIVELVRPLNGALVSVGTRSYGALVYANMANASTQQHDVIRAGDIISFRNAKFQGKHGAMHAKYSSEVGKPDHVAVVSEWDGTKKKVRAWEQGRENKKVKVESYKLDDLRSGEVKIWRVVPRSWVGWNVQP